MTAGQDELLLSDDELAFLRFTCGLFFSPESPLAYVEQQDLIPASFKATARSLADKGVIDPDSWEADSALAERLSAVSECDARIVIGVRRGRRRALRVCYGRDGQVVEHQRRGRLHAFRRPRSETALVAELVQGLATPAEAAGSSAYHFSAAEFLHFALYARDERGRAAGPRLSSEQLDAALADLPDGPTPDSNREWRRVQSQLLKRGYLVLAPGGRVALAPPLAGLVRELDLEAQRSYERQDFVDEEWLLRQLTLFPIAAATWRLAPTRDGGLCLTELDREGLAECLAATLSSLPELDALNLADRSVTELLLRR